MTKAEKLNSVSSQYIKPDARDKNIKSQENYLSIISNL